MDLRKLLMRCILWICLQLASGREEHFCYIQADCNPVLVAKWDYDDHYDIHNHTCLWKFESDSSSQDYVHRQDTITLGAKNSGVYVSAEPGMYMYMCVFSTHGRQKRKGIIAQFYVELNQGAVIPFDNPSCFCMKDDVVSTPSEIPTTAPEEEVVTTVDAQTEMQWTTTGSVDIVSTPEEGTTTELTETTAAAELIEDENLQSTITTELPETTTASTELEKEQTTTTELPETTTKPASTELEKEQTTTTGLPETTTATTTTRSELKPASTELEKEHTTTTGFPETTTATITTTTTATATIITPTSADTEFDKAQSPTKMLPERTKATSTEHTKVLKLIKPKITMVEANTQTDQLTKGDTETVPTAGGKFASEKTFSLSLILIMAICVPVSVVLIVTTVIYWLKKRHRNSQSNFEDISREKGAIDNPYVTMTVMRGGACHNKTTPIRETTNGTLLLKDVCVHQPQHS